MYCAYLSKLKCSILFTEKLFYLKYYFKFPKICNPPIHNKIVCWGWVDAWNKELSVANHELCVRITNHACKSLSRDSIRAQNNLAYVNNIRGVLGDHIVSWIVRYYSHSNERTFSI